MLFGAAFWLPVQAMAALAMPLCRHAQDQQSDPRVQGGADSGAEATPCHHESADDVAVVPDGCDNCEMCHMASAGFMPSTPISAGVTAPGREFSLPSIAAPPSHIAEPPQHPPRRTA